MYYGEHNQRLLLNHIISLSELIRYLEHLPLNYLIHSLLLQMLEFFKSKLFFSLYVAIIMCPGSRLYIIFSMTFENEVS
jgi:hypothetical protein